MFLTLLATLVLEAAPQPDEASPVDCFVTARCRIERTKVGAWTIAALFDDNLADESDAQVAIADPYLTVTWFDAGDVYSSTAHMAEDRDLEWYDHAHVTAGTLADGSAAAVIRLDWSHQDYREGEGLAVVWRSRPAKHADVVVCALGDAPACSKPVRVDGRPKVSLRKGVLRIGRQRFTIDSPR